MIPRANLRNLMLRSDVVSAVKEGKFHIYAVGTIDEGLEVLTGVSAGQRQDDGQYPKETVNDRVQRTLLHYAEQQKRLTGEDRDPSARGK
jgi:predicted ATP-dependent protease